MDELTPFGFSPQTGDATLLTGESKRDAPLEVGEEKKTQPATGGPLSSSSSSSTPPKPHLNYSGEEVVLLVQCLQAWRICLKTTDKQVVERFKWFWKWIVAAVRHYGEQNPTVSVDTLLQKLQAVTNGIDMSSASEVATQSLGSVPMEDTFFDKTVQTLVHEHLPMGVIMLQMGPDGYSAVDQPIVNSMAVEMFGYTREELLSILTDARGMSKLYHKSGYLEAFKRFIESCMIGVDSYVQNTVYVHKTGWMFEGLESRRICYGRSGVPLYTTIYIQKCDSPSGQDETGGPTGASSSSSSAQQQQAQQGFPQQ